MCFGRLIGAATGLEVARGGDDHELVEDLKWDGQKRRLLGCQCLFFSIFFFFVVSEKFTKMLILTGGR